MNESTFAMLLEERTYYKDKCEDLESFLKFCAGHDIYYGSYSSKISILRKIRKRASVLLKKYSKQSDNNDK